MKYIITLATLLLLFVSAMAQDMPEPMSPRRIVNDFTGVFTPEQTAQLERKLRSFNDTTSTQIAVVTVSTLDGYAPNDYAQRLAEKWEIGQKGKDNGILLLVKPKTRDEKGQVAIAVGYGLEGAVPDAIASRIIRNEIIPEFQRDNYYGGVDRATNVLMNLTSGEYTANQYARKGEGGTPGWVLLIPLIFFIVLPLTMKKHRGYTTGSQGSSVPPFFVGGFGRSDSSFGSFSSGGGSFGGFGGGGFGGGGASGSW